MEGERAPLRATSSKRRQAAKEPRIPPTPPLLYALQRSQPGRRRPCCLGERALVQVGPPLTRFPRHPGEAGFGDRATCWRLPVLPPAPGPLRPCPQRHSTGEVVRCRFLGLTRGLLNQKLSGWVLVVESEQEPSSDPDAR